VTPIGTSCFGLLAGWAVLASAQQPPATRCGADSASGTQSIRLYLSPIRVDSGYRLTPYSYSGATHVEQNIEFTGDSDSAPPAPVLGVPTRRIDTRNAVQFVSPSLAGPFDLSGFFSGRLELITNKPDFDFQIALYEVRSTGDYVLSSTYSTKSTAGDDHEYRALLQTGIRQYRAFESTCFASRVVQNGSRLVVVITILGPSGAGGNAVTRTGVGDTLIGDVSAPLKIGWYGGSYIELRVRHH